MMQRKSPSSPPRRHHDSKGHRRSGFTLIELLVAVTVLAVITLMLARIITQSNNVISEGARQAAQNANARMALDSIAKDLIQSAADPRLKFVRDATPGAPAVATTYGNNHYPCHSLRFASFRNIQEPDGITQDREAVRVAYYVKDMYSTIGCYSLMRAEKPITANESYSNIVYNPVVSEEAELIRYVVEFRAVCHGTNNYNLLTDSVDIDYMPSFVDVYLGVISESDARRAKSFPLGSPGQTNCIARAVKRYHTRCWSLNAGAYMGSAGGR